MIMAGMLCVSTSDPCFFLLSITISIIANIIMAGVIGSLAMFSSTENSPMLQHIIMTSKVGGVILSRL